MNIKYRQTISSRIDFELLAQYARPGMELLIPTKDGKEITFLVLEVKAAGDKTRILIQQHKDLESVPYCQMRNDGKSLNEYEGSDLQKYALAYKERFPKEIAEKIDGDFFVPPADWYDPEETSIEYYKDRSHLTKYNKWGYSDWYWSSTPVAGDSYNARLVDPSGGVVDIYAICAFGAAPACYILI